MTTMIDPQAVRHETVLDEKSRHVARVYAEALLKAADARQQSAEIRDELNALIQDVFRRHPELELFLASPAIGRKPKNTALLHAFEGRASEILVRFLQVLNEHDRLDALRGVVATYRDLFDRQSGRIHVEVRSAVPLTEEQREQLRQQLRSRFHQEPMLETRIDPELLGGLVVRVGDWVYDASVRARLDMIRNQLNARSSYAIQSGRNRFSS